MRRYVIRLDDASEKRDIEKWDRMEEILDRFGVKPLVGVIPQCKYYKMEQYAIDKDFWKRVDNWIAKGWTIAMHGFNHVMNTECGGINPVHKRSEFAGVPLSVQKDMISKGVAIMRAHGIEPQVFFAPWHTFDEKTLVVLKECSNIRIISDTIAGDVYSREGFTFVPQQSGSVKYLPFRTVTFCYHPNTIGDRDFDKLEHFLAKNKNHSPFPCEETERRYSGADWMAKRTILFRRKIWSCFST